MEVCAEKACAYKKGALNNPSLQYHTTVNREDFMSKIFHAINFHVKYFSDK